MADWSELPQDLLQLVYELLHPLDHPSFRAVCNHWRSFQKSQFFLPTTNRRFRRIPWLIICSSSNYQNQCFFTISDQKTRHFNLPELQGQHLYGSTNGWLVTTSQQSMITIFNLYHPLSRVWVPLPRSINCATMYKVVMSSDPLINPKECVIMAIANGPPKLYFCRPGDEKWTQVEMLDEKLVALGCFIDITYYKTNFYAVTDSGFLVVCEVFGTQANSTIYYLPLSMDSLQMMYVVECMGELLLVGERKSRFMVYRCNGSLTEWEEVQSLGDKSLFLGFNQSFSISSDELPGCKGNSIYYAADDNWGPIDLPIIEHRMRDSGVYNIGDRSFVPFYRGGYDGGQRHAKLHSIWLMPSPNNDAQCEQHLKCLRECFASNNAQTRWLMLLPWQLVPKNKNVCPCHSLVHHGLCHHSRTMFSINTRCNVLQNS
ncbi:putative F-box/kelch-repeat protein [Acorus calamus]|uniref:F-box/kelch-repeat protein n=1 Tax=Acorus calamus TaxID=4465 RepID=A0AAV9FGN2_ACOCL|nr:putative F-box/kelch-repeat protein [Acorus calamus]